MGNIITNIDGEWFLKDKSGKVLMRKADKEPFHKFEKRCAEYRDSDGKDRHES